MDFNESSQVHSSAEQPAQPFPTRPQGTVTTPRRPSGGCHRWGWTRHPSCPGLGCASSVRVSRGSAQRDKHWHVELLTAPAAPRSACSSLERGLKPRAIPT